jgi:acetate kinase
LIDCFERCYVRAAIYGGLSWVGVRFDDARTRSAGNPISDAASRFAVQVLASQEDQQIARHTRQLVAGREIHGHRMATK